MADIDPFAMRTLKKLATGSDGPSGSDNNYKAGSVSDAQRNQDYANKRLAKPAAKVASPLASPMTPQAGPSKPTPAAVPAAAPVPFVGKISNQ